MAAASFRISRVDQVALVVGDIDRAMEAYWRVGVGPWRVYTYDETVMRELIYRGRPARCRWVFAMADVAGIGLELIQPLAGDSIFSEYLDRHGEGGLQHIGINVDDVDYEIGLARELGYEVLQIGKGFGVQGDGKFAYLGTEDDLHTIVELRELPRVRRAPDRVYPPA